MKKLSSGQAIKLIENFTKKLIDQKHVNINEQDFLAIVPLEKNQAMVLTVDENEDGERVANYYLSEHVYIDKKLKNTVFGPESLERVNNGNASI